MPRGKSSKRVSATIREELHLGKAGIRIVVWNKGRKKHMGILTVSVGGLRWNPYKTRKPSRMGWLRFAELMEENGRI